MQPSMDRALENSVTDAEGAKNSQAKGQGASNSIFIYIFEFDILPCSNLLGFEFFCLKIFLYKKE